MKETPFFFLNRGRRLFGVLHEPGGKSPREGFVFCSAFAEEKLWSHRVMVGFARLLVQRGHPVMRFDYQGSGDSEGDFEDTTIETMVSDTCCALRTFQERIRNPGPVNLLGLRLGASIAVFAASESEAVKALLLWEPVVDGAGYAKSLLRVNLATQAAVYGNILENSDRIVSRLNTGETANIDGYEMTSAMYRGIAGMDVGALAALKSWNRPCLIVAVNRKKGARRPDLEKLQRHLGGAHLYEVEEEPFWKEIRLAYRGAPNLFDLTLRWLEHDER